MVADLATFRQMLHGVTGKEFDEQTVTEQTSFRDDLGLTSIQTVDLIMAIEERFGIEIEDVDLGKLRTIGETIAYIKEKTQST